MFFIQVSLTVEENEGVTLGIWVEAQATVSQQEISLTSSIYKN